MKKSQFGFIIRPSHEYLQSVLSKEQLGSLWILIIEYLKCGDIDALIFDCDVVKLAFLSIKSQIDKDRGQYEKKCEINRLNGAKGGRPTKNVDEF